MPNFESVSTNILSIEPIGVEKSNGIDGRIVNCDKKFIYIKIVEGFEYFTILNKGPFQFFNINFHMNQTTYQLQLEALEFIKEHQLFEILIDNVLYSKIIDDSTHTQQTLRLIFIFLCRFICLLMENLIYFSCTYSDKLNNEQKIAIQNIAEASCRPVPYLLFGPAG